MDDDPAEKFNTCKFRAEGENVYTYKGCCSIQTALGFHCFKLNLEGVRPELCFRCIAWEPKEENLNH